MSVPILGIDPGFANIGYAMVLLEADGREVPVQMGLFQTEKSSKKQNTLASDDNVRRSREIYVFFRDLCVKGPHGPARAICAESMSFPRHAGSAAKMAMCWGVISALSVVLDIPIVQTSPQALKKLVADSKKASKEEVQAALERRFGEKTLSALCCGTTPSSREHLYDALGAVVACKDSEVLRLARKMSAG